MRRMHGLWAVALLLGLVARAWPQRVELPDPSFAQDPPAGWTLSEGTGRWLAQGAQEPGAIAVTGDGESTSYWRSAPLPLAPSSVYLLRFQARSLGGREGTPITGPVFCNRDLGALGEEWTRFSSVFATPDTLPAERSWLRFGQWHVQGEVAFDQVWLAAAQPLYSRQGELVLGEGEKLDGTGYSFVAPFNSVCANQSRPLFRHRCDFNTHRWVFGAGSYVVYRHQIAGHRQMSAQVEVNINYYQGGELVVEASADGVSWRELGAVDRQTARSFAVPAELFPTEALWVRLRARAQSRVGTESDPGSFQVDSYVYRARVEGAPGEFQGSTRFVAVEEADPRLRVRVAGLGEGLPGGDDRVRFEVDNTSDQPLALRPQVRVAGEGKEAMFSGPDTAVGPGAAVLSAPYEMSGAGSFDLELSLGPQVRFQARAQISVPSLFAGGYGQVLPGSSPAVGLWWASSGWKVSRRRALPTEKGEAIRISAARDETEAAQLVVRPQAELKGLTASASSLQGPDGAVIPAAWVEVLRVRYVEVVHPTDLSGAAAPWPDPLPRFRGPIDLAAGQNQPLWVRVHVPAKTAAGLYQGQIRLAARGFQAEVPLQVEVYDFQLPERMSCTTAFGFSPDEVFRYQKLGTAAQRRAVLDRYLEDFSRHRISPYDPSPMDPIQVSWTGDMQPVFVWGAWDAAMSRAIDVLHFNSFRLHVEGLGGGTYHDRVEPELRGYRENTPEYQRAFRAYLQGLERHLREKGWLDEAYVYWFDEPEPKDYGFVMNGFRKLRENAPGIRRMLTEQPEPALAGGPDVWCPVTNAYEPRAARERQRAGDAVWWYVCTSPKTPYAGEFIDHPATQMRVWLWQTWKYQVQGILVWQTNYWTSEAAYPDRPQNPYADPMSWVSGYSTPAGVRQGWGNGDGRFLYPPEEAAGADAAGPVLDGPVDSIRWEMLRDGVEDYEYFALLQRLLAAKGAGLAPEERQRYEELLQVPQDVAADMTHFTQDPAPLEAHRQALARAIEELGRR